MLTSAPRTRPMQARAKERVQRILDATARLLKAEGYDRLTTNHVAREAGVPIGSVYRYFPDKESLLRELIDRHSERMLALLDDKIGELAGAPVAIGARAYVTAMLQLHAEDPQLHRALYAESPRLRGSVIDLNAEATRRVRAYLELHRDALRPKNLELAAFLLVSSVEAVTHTAVREHPEALDREELTDEVVQLVLGYLGLAAPQGPEKERRPAPRPRRK